MQGNKPTLTEKDAVLQALDLWLWLFKNPGKRKEDYPDFNIIKLYKSNCPLCEYYIDCNGCIGDYRPKSWLCFFRAFSQWKLTKQKRYSAYIASKIRRFAWKQGYIPEKNLTNKL